MNEKTVIDLTNTMDRLILALEKNNQALGLFRQKQATMTPGKFRKQQLKEAIIKSGGEFPKRGCTLATLESIKDELGLTEDTITELTTHNVFIEQTPNTISEAVQKLEETLEVVQEVEVEEVQEVIEVQEEPKKGKAVFSLNEILKLGKMFKNSSKDEEFIKERLSEMYAECGIYTNLKDASKDELQKLGKVICKQLNADEESIIKLLK